MQKAPFPAPVIAAMPAQSTAADKPEESCSDDQPLISLVSRTRKTSKCDDTVVPKAKKPKPAGGGCETTSSESTSTGSVVSTPKEQNPLKSAAVREAFARLVVARLQGRPDPF